MKIKAEPEIEEIVSLIQKTQSRIDGIRSRCPWGFKHFSFFIKAEPDVIRVLYYNSISEKEGTPEFKALNDLIFAMQEDFEKGILWQEISTGLTPSESKLIGVYPTQERRRKRD